MLSSLHKHDDKDLSNLMCHDLIQLLEPSQSIVFWVAWFQCSNILLIYLLVVSCSESLICTVAEIFSSYRYSLYKDKRHASDSSASSSIKVPLLQGKGIAKEAVVSLD